MKPFGTPVRQFDAENPNVEKLAAWMLDLLDEGPDKLAIIKLPPHRDDDDLNMIEARFLAAYDIAKAERPDLSVKMLQAVDLNNGMPRDRIAVAVHEHYWAGGECVNGCREERSVP